MISNGKEIQQKTCYNRKMNKDNRKHLNWYHSLLLYICKLCLVYRVCQNYILVRNNLDTTNTAINNKIDSSNWTKLERIDNSPSPSILSSPEEIHRGSSATVVPEETTKRSHGKKM